MDKEKSVDRLSQASPLNLSEEEANTLILNQLIKLRAACEFNRELLLEILHALSNRSEAELQQALGELEDEIYARVFEDLLKTAAQEKPSLGRIPEAIAEKYKKRSD